MPEGLFRPDRSIRNIAVESIKPEVYQFSLDPKEYITDKELEYIFNLTRNMEANLDSFVRSALFYAGYVADLLTIWPEYRQRFVPSNLREKLLVEINDEDNELREIVKALKLYKILFPGQFTDFELPETFFDNFTEDYHTDDTLDEYMQTMANYRLVFPERFNRLRLNSDILKQFVLRLTNEREAYFPTILGALLPQDYYDALFNLKVLQPSSVNHLLDENLDERTTIFLHTNQRQFEVGRSQPTPYYPTVLIHVLARVQQLSQGPIVPHEDWIEILPREERSIDAIPDLPTERSY